jgi:hypothetical protein
LWNALHTAASDSGYAIVRTVYVPDTTGLARASVIAFHYNGFLNAVMDNFNERAGFGKYTLYFSPSVNEAVLRNKLQAAGIQF